MHGNNPLPLAERFSKRPDCRRFFLRGRQAPTSPGASVNAQAHNQNTVLANVDVAGGYRVLDHSRDLFFFRGLGTPANIKIPPPPSTAVSLMTAGGLPRADSGSAL